VSAPPREPDGRFSFRPTSVPSRVLAALEDGPATLKELRAALDANPTTVERAVTETRNRKAVYIASWQDDEVVPGRMLSVAVYALGNKKDAPRPRRRHVDAAAYQRAKRARRRTRLATAFNPAAVLAASTGATR